MTENRIIRLDKLLYEEFPVLVKKYYEEFSEKYKFIYTPLSSVDTNNGKVNLFKYIEDYFKENYNIEYSIYKHFEFHTTSLFYAPTDDFGLSMRLKNKDELPEILRGDFQNGYEQLNEFGIFSNVFCGVTGLSSVIKKKINEDFDLECELIKLRLKSSLKRFFIQGQVDWKWIVADQICFHGINKFPNCLDAAFDLLEYSISFYEKYGHLTELYYFVEETGCHIQCPKSDEKIKKLEKEYYSKLKLKSKSNYSYLDVLNDYFFNENIRKIISQYENKKTSNVVVNAECLVFGKVPLFELRNKFNYINEKGQYDNVYFNYLKYINSNSDTDVIPIKFPLNFNLKLQDVFNDEILIHEYLATFNEPENEIRSLFGLPKIGEGWISETNLFYEIKSHFIYELVVHHGRPNWLGKQHLDIYFPKFNIGIEYQGDQHYYPIDFFGGEASFIKNKQRDEVKKQLCLKNNCHLIFVNPGYNLSDVIKQIEKSIENNFNN